MWYEYNSYREHINLHGLNQIKDIDRSFMLKNWKKIISMSLYVKKNSLLIDILTI